MRKIDIDEIRARCEAATPGTLAAYAVPAVGRDTILALLDALEAETARADGYERAAHNMADDDLKSRTCARVIQERNHWKARAEALEQAIKAEKGLHFATACFTCLCFNNHDEYCTPCEENGFEAWQFDQARFTADTTPPGGS